MASANLTNGPALEKAVHKVINNPEFQESLKRDGMTEEKIQKLIKQINSV
jgi:hypothetical protein